MATHIICILLHVVKYMINIFYLKNYEENKKKDNIFNSPYLIEILSVLKIVLYFISIIYVQSKVSTNYSERVKNVYNVWLLYEVAIFYFHLFAMIFFLLFSRVRSFRTLRERVGFGAKMRYKIDFLDFVQNDVHWFLIIVSQLFLSIFALLQYKFDKDGNKINAD